MASSVNVVVIVGNLTRDPELRSIPSGTSVCELGVAVNERYKNGAGEWGERANFFDVVVWGAQGESCARFLSKGRAVAVQGRLRWESWEKDGQKRSKVRIVAESVQFLGGGERDGGGESSGGYRMESDLGGDAEPVPASAAAAADDDIPFVWRPVEFEDRYEHGSRWQAPVL